MARLIPMKKFAKGLAGFFSAGMMTLFALSFICA
jgi:hypothetical protein